MHTERDMCLYGEHVTMMACYVLFYSGADCDFCFFLLLTTVNQKQRSKGLSLWARVNRPLDHPPVTVHPLRGNRQGDPARRVQATLCQRTSYTGAFTTTRHLTGHFTQRALSSLLLLGRPAENASDANCATFLEARLDLFWSEDWPALWALVRAECDVPAIAQTRSRTKAEQTETRVRKVATLARAGEKGRALAAARNAPQRSRASTLLILTQRSHLRPESHSHSQLRSWISSRSPSNECHDSANLDP